MPKIEVSHALSVAISAVVILAGGVAAATNWDLREFAECISASGARYYGTHWCPYCAKQNALFGENVRYLPYVECSPPGSREKLRRCSHIEGYPTWIFADGSSRSGVLSLKSLATQTGCQLREKSYFVD